MTYPYPPPVPPPPPRRPKSSARLVLFVVLGVVVLCGGAVVGTVAAVNHSVTRATTATQLNAPARDDGLEFTVTSVSCGKTVEGYGSFTTTAQGQFCEVSLTVRNVGKDARVFVGALQKAKAADGTTYRDSAEAESRVNTDGRTFFTQINPGNQVHGILVFDIPGDARIATLELHAGLVSPGVVIAVGQ